VNPTRSSQRTVRLLLIEDHAGLAEATAEYLRSEGLEVRIAESGEEALETAGVFQPEIVLCDLSLPDMSGLDVARALRANPDTKDAVMALYSAMAESDVRTLERQVNPNEVNLFLSKPLTEDKLNQLLAGLDWNKA